METLPLYNNDLDPENTDSVKGTSKNTAAHYLDEQEKIARICLYRSQNVGPVTYRTLLKRYKTARKALEALPHLAARGGLRGPLKLYPEEKVHQELRAHEKMGALLVVEGEKAYPKILKHLEEMPPVLSLHGDPKHLKPPSLSIVGARNCSLNGKKIAYQLSKTLGENGYRIVSGLARGIDGQAHQAALDTGTIAVIAGGIDKIYPTEHAKLFSQIIEKGLIIAESIFGTEPQSNLFPKRNRLISGLSQGVIVIEAALQSGSLITARYAAEQNKEVFIVPGSPMDPRYSGSNALIRNGATLITCAQDVLETIEEPCHQALLEAAREQAQDQDNYTLEVGAPDPQLITQLCQDILDNLSCAPISLDELLKECSYSSSLVLSALLELELGGKITRHPGNKISI